MLRNSGDYAEDDGHHVKREHNGGVLKNEWDKCELVGEAGMEGWGAAPVVQYGCTEVTPG